MAGGGTITITAENVQESAANGSPADLVKLSVADTGSGMPPEVLARVLRAVLHYQGRQERLGTGPAAGLWLRAAVRRSITIDSEVGVGTIVTLLLPRSLQQPVASAEPPTHQCASGLEAIAHSGAMCYWSRMIAKSSALTREMLSCLGFSVIHVTSADAALGALANARSIDIVLSDIMMPGGVSGLELAREIQRRHPTCRSC